MLGAAAGLAISMPGALAFSASPAAMSLHSPSALNLRASARKSPLTLVKASLRSATRPVLTSKRLNTCVRNGVYINAVLLR